VALAVLALFAMMVMTFADVVLRSTLDAPIEAATELTRILMAIVVFAVLPSVSGRGSHIVVDLLDGQFSARAARWRDAIISLVCGGILILPANRVVVLSERARSYGDVTEYLAIPQFYVGWFIAAFVYLTVTALLLRGVLLLIAPEALEPTEPAHD
jgi:TRAP-type C4-dicarboxylate transport system permease small subunit